MNPNEFRTPLNPYDCKILILNGFEIIVESSNKRIYSDALYENAGCILTKEPWYLKKFESCFILGIKSPVFPSHIITPETKHNHIYFAHCYENQTGSDIQKNYYDNTNSKLFDLEYFLDEKDKRMVSFCFYAGVVGCILGCLEYYQFQIMGKSISNLGCFESEEYALKNIEYLMNKSFFHPKIAIIGPNGKTGSGVRYILDSLKLEYDCFSRETSKENLVEYDIIFNCIKLSPESTEKWIDERTQFHKNVLLVDISCDVTKKNNPFPVYHEITTWKEPVLEVHENLRVISIDNLPSMMPLESSNRFSRINTNITWIIGR